MTSSLSQSLTLPPSSGRVSHWQGGLFFKLLYYVFFSACLRLLSFPSERRSTCLQRVPCYSCGVFHCMNKPHIIYPFFCIFHFIPMNIGIFPVLILRIKLLWICPFGEHIQPLLFDICLRESLLEHRGFYMKTWLILPKSFPECVCVCVCVCVWVSLYSQ